jgi:hypothetical protein
LIGQHDDCRFAYLCPPLLPVNHEEKGLINTIMCRQTYDIKFSVDGKRQMICRPER